MEKVWEQSEVERYEKIKKLGFYFREKSPTAA